MPTSTLTQPAGTVTSRTEQQTPAYLAWLCAEFLADAATIHALYCYGDWPAIADTDQHFHRLDKWMCDQRAVIELWLAGKFAQPPRNEPLHLVTHPAGVDMNKVRDCLAMSVRKLVRDRASCELLYAPWRWLDAIAFEITKLNLGDGT